MIREKEDTSLLELLLTDSSSFLSLQTPEAKLIWWSTGVVSKSMMSNLATGAALPFCSGSNMPWNRKSPSSFSFPLPNFLFTRAGVVWIPSVTRKCQRLLSGGSNGIRAVSKPNKSKPSSVKISRSTAASSRRRLKSISRLLAAGRSLKFNDGRRAMQAQLNKCVQHYDSALVGLNIVLFSLPSFKYWF